MEKAVIARMVRYLDISDEARDWMASTDTAWPYSFENLCRVLKFNAAMARKALDQQDERDPVWPLFILWRDLYSPYKEVREVCFARVEKMDPSDHYGWFVELCRWIREDPHTLRQRYVDRVAAAIKWGIELEAALLVLAKRRAKSPDKFATPRVAQERYRHKRQYAVPPFKFLDAVRAALRGTSNRVYRTKAISRNAKRIRKRTHRSK